MLLMEANKVLIELLRRYEFSLVNPVKPVRVVSALVMVMHDFWVRKTKRER